MAQSKPVSKKLNIIMLLVGVGMILAAIPVIIIATKTYKEGATFNLVNGIGNMLILIGLGIACFNAVGFLIKALRNKDESGNARTKANAFWMYAASLLFSFAVFIVYLIIRSEDMGEIIAFAVICFVVAALFFFINFAKMRKKIRNENYREYQKRRPSPSPSSTPKPTREMPRSEPEYEYPPEDTAFVYNFKTNRMGKDLVIGGTHGWATLDRVYVSYNRKTGVYTVNPSIDIHFNELTIKSQADVDDVIRRVRSAYQEELELMVSVFDRYEYSYDIKEPHINSNIDRLGR